MQSYPNDHITWSTPTLIQFNDIISSSSLPQSVHPTAQTYYFAHTYSKVIKGLNKQITAFCFPWNCSHLNHGAIHTPSTSSRWLCGLAHTHTPSQLVHTEEVYCNRAIWMQQILARSYLECPPKWIGSGCRALIWTHRRVMWAGTHNSYHVGPMSCTCQLRDLTEKDLYLHRFMSQHRLRTSNTLSGPLNIITCS